MVQEIAPHSRYKSGVSDCEGMSAVLNRLENPDAPEVKDFVAKQVELADGVLEGCETREKLKKKVTALYNYPRYGCPTKRRSCCFYNHNTGLQSQSMLYVQVDFSPPTVGAASCINLVQFLAMARSNEELAGDRRCCTVSDEHDIRGSAGRRNRGVRNFVGPQHAQ